MTDDRVRTRITVAPRRRHARGARDAAMVRRRTGRVAGCLGALRRRRRTRRPRPGVLEALETADTIVICPSNPVISIGPILAVPGVRDVLVARRDRVVGVSPIVGGAPVKGPADRLMAPARHRGVVRRRRARVRRRSAASLVIDAVDAAPRGRGRGGGRATPSSTDTMMRSPEIAAALAAADARRGGVTLSIIPIAGIGEIRPGDELAVLVADAAAAQGTPLADGDCLVVTQKIVSKAENRLVPLDPDDLDARRALVESESVRIVRRRGDLIISETRARLRVRERRRRPLERRARLGRAPARRLRPFGQAHPRRAACPRGRRGRGRSSPTRSAGRGAAASPTSRSACSGIAAVVDLRDTPDALGRVAARDRGGDRRRDRVGRRARDGQGRERPGRDRARARPEPGSAKARSASSIRPPNEDLFR